MVLDIDNVARTASAFLGSAVATAILLKLLQRSRSGSSSNPDDHITDTDHGTSASDAAIEDRTGDIPVVGDGSGFMKDYMAALMDLSSKVANNTKYGLGYVDNFGTKTLIVTNPTYVRKLLQQNTAHSLGGLRAASEAFFGKKVLFVLEGEEWKYLRNTMRESFKRQRLPEMCQAVTKVAQTLSNCLQPYADNQEPADMNLAFSMYHLSAIGFSAFNYDLGYVERLGEGPNDIVNAFEFMLAELPRRAFSQDPTVNADYETDNEDNRKWKHASGTLRNAVADIIQRRLKERIDTSQRKRYDDLLDAMLDVYAEERDIPKDNIPLDDDVLNADISDNLIEILFAGYNTSVVSMSTALYYLAKNKQWHEKVQEEIRAAIPGEGIPQGKELHISQFPLVECIVKESLRLVPPAALVARYTTEPSDLGEVQVPANTNVWFPATYLHQDPQSWGDDAHEFNPYRFMKEKPHPQGAFVPFSDGKRNCIGQHFAMMESVIALAVLLKSYTFEVAEGFSFKPVFTGFGLRPFDLTSGKVCMNLIPRHRVDATDYLFDWSPIKMPKRQSNPYLNELPEYDNGNYNDNEGLPQPPGQDSA